MSHHPKILEKAMPGDGTAGYGSYPTLSNALDSFATPGGCEVNVLLCPGGNRTTQPPAFRAGALPIELPNHARSSHEVLGEGVEPPQSMTTGLQPATLANELS